MTALVDHGKPSLRNFHLLSRRAFGRFGNDKIQWQVVHGSLKRWKGIFRDCGIAFGTRRSSPRLRFIHYDRRRDAASLS